jgi:Cell Wall Hydrolase
MAKPTRPVAAKARPDYRFARLLGGLVFSVLGYAALAGQAHGPADGVVLPDQAVSPALVASLSYSGDDVTITGSVDHMFEAVSFVGPNRAEKQNRARIDVDVLTVARSFDEVRLRLAALRNGPSDPVYGEQSRLADLGAPATDDGPRISVAAIDPSLISSSAALDAIDGAATGGQSVAPMPLLASTDLAYARANAPITEFEVKSKSGKLYSEKELWCLATAIYFEARGESYRGQVAVGQVVMNRVAHRLYPNTICGVVFQNQSWRNRCQFSFACDGIPETINDRQSWAQAQEIAKGVAKSELYLTEVANATHYHASYVYPHWAPKLKKVTKIGLHIFYRFKRG